MTEEAEFEAFKSAWADYPSQDNEGFVPDRGGFKCGWFAALRWINPELVALRNIEVAVQFVVSKAMITITDHHDQTAWDQLRLVLAALDKIRQV